jgi:hypothetical protein
MGEHRNSYSKTDTDATFMRMKEDHMKNGQLKPAYNTQISTQEQFVLKYDIYQERNDTGTYISHLEGYYSNYNTYPEEVVADAGYGSEENYDFLEQNNITGYVKYNLFYKEQKRKFKNDISRVENLYYNEKEDYFICPMGQKMLPVSVITRKTSRGYEQNYVVYEAQNCQSCPLRGACHKSKGNRRIQVNHTLMKYKNLARKNLNSEKGVKYRKQRNHEPETIFGQIKQNKGFRRFLLRGLDKVEIEFGLLLISHNIQKLWKLIKNTKKDFLFEIKTNFFAYLNTQMNFAG